jgi:hypothetical protein
VLRIFLSLTAGLVAVSGDLRGVACAAPRSRKRSAPRGCPRKSFRQRILIGCFSPVDFVLVGEEMLLVAARRRMARGSY